MKTMISLLLLVTCIVPFFLEGKESGKEKLYRLYVQPSDVKIVQKGVYAHLGNVWVSVKKIARDQNGIYVTGPAVEKGLSECRGCGYVYYTNRHPSKCPRCGRTNS